MWQFSQWLLIFYERSLTMKVTYQTCCGVDLHKSFLVATIVKTTGGIEPSYQKKCFSTLLTLTKKAGVLRSWMSFIPFPLGVEFTNSYQEPVNSTSHFDAYFSSFLLIIDALCYKCHHFCNKKLPPYGI